VTTQELTRRIIIRLIKLKWLIIMGGIGFAALMYFYAKGKPVFYTAKSSFYPLSSPASNPSSKLMEQIGGGGGGSKSLTEDANINIEEVAKSKKTRQAVVAEKLPEFENKSIAELLILELNKDRSYFTKEMEVPKVDTQLYALGAELIKNLYSAKFSKTNLLEINFTSKNVLLLQPITNVLTNKVIAFYKELKIKKAKVDFEFLQAKVDSFDYLLSQFDKKRIVLDNTSLFVRPNKLKFSVPVENLENQKNLVLTQRNSAVYNREEANLRLQKITPVIDMLDSPTPPYDNVGTSKIMYAAIGFFLGIILFSFLFIVGLIAKYSNAMVKNTIAEKTAIPSSLVEKSD
jgi:hypothetical protein